MVEAVDVAVAAAVPVSCSCSCTMSLLSFYGLVWSFVMRIDSVPLVSTSFWVKSWKKFRFYRPSGLGCPSLVVFKVILWATWYSARCPCLRCVCMWSRWSLNVPSNMSHLMIWWNTLHQFNSSLTAFWEGTARRLGFICIPGSFQV